MVRMVAVIDMPTAAVAAAAAAENNRTRVDEPNWWQQVVADKAVALPCDKQLD